MNKEELVNYLINNPDKRKQLDKLCKVNNLLKEEVLKALAVKFREQALNVLKTKYPSVQLDSNGNVILDFIKPINL